MAFSPNPLSLSVPDPAFESWLRDSGYLELLDHRTSAAAAAASSSASVSSSAAATSAASDDVVSSITGGFFASLLSRLVTVSSLLTINPFSKLSADDFSGDTTPWTTGFIGNCDSYSFPSSSQQARMRVHENIKRFARNYATLFIVFFACALYQMPLALVGLLGSLALWELFKYCSDKWKFDRHPSMRKLSIGIGQCATAVLLTFLNVQMALFSALAISYSVMILHAGFRKLTPSKKPTRGR
ncbi:P family protein H [Arabidopsis thaliana]|uniref:PRA1 family protein H n=4 Tax=Arabidopsis TaxID=3701 RepID=PRA1H_ARATH|nr:prenylated RAB acceptor 1.H [Arabidopsis thaliana]Q8LFP1.1 RecName: Full=PRA1 family protein H; Short=AtPRA1.H [Arabidopsis thaliana]KAG7617552.1 Prenylated rab acceptor PRA1 [Arabidopsis thaliana x Arabidopsis arenosa]KAG7622007.1 Prenylated rab acceptor PRA1 [Arabidopsis suecica]AAM61302.1 unknown [Arabidopsis thaliana]ABE77405.1 At4g27540 [Arabidopsis thaliana]AEE85355.1 prenylated RAB acceptor 1.H [Arabidopsis thaliana]|eukprot:NP_567776.1 prenylated RAB acceptor 1.H [Arabidopsis thaliana]